MTKPTNWTQTWQSQSADGKWKNGKITSLLLFQVCWESRESEGEIWESTPSWHDNDLVGTRHPLSFRSTSHRIEGVGSWFSQFAKFSNISVSIHSPKKAAFHILALQKSRSTEGRELPMECLSTRRARHHPEPWHAALGKRGGSRELIPASPLLIILSHKEVRFVFS